MIRPAPRSRSTVRSAAASGRRCLRPVLALLVLASPVAATAPPPLDEAAVVRIARTHAPGAAVARATDSLAAAHAESAGLLPNPSLAWERETFLDGSPDATQDIFRTTIPFDIAQPLATRSLAAAESSWMLAEASEQRTAAVLDALLAYVDVVVAEQRVTLLHQAERDLEEALRVVRRRATAGTAAGYESSRLAVARGLAASRLAEEQGARRNANARLAASLGLDPNEVRVDARLDLADPTDLPARTSRPASRNETLRHAADATRAADGARRRAAWTWLPRLSVNGGANFGDETDTRHGYVAGVSVDLPLFDHGQALRSEAAARSALAVARNEALTRTLQADLDTAWSDYETARQEFERFTAATGAEIEALVRAATSGYREGRFTVVELLDAQRARTEVAEQQLALLAAAKRAEARVRAAAGEFAGEIQE